MIDQIKLGNEVKVRAYNVSESTEIFTKVLHGVSKPSEKSWNRVWFDDESYLDCTEDHKFLTTNRGWVESKSLGIDDDLVLSKS